MIDTVSTKCSGCNLCSNICPKSAITIVNDKVLNHKPVVDTDKCIKCKLCINSCPFITPPKKDNSFKPYALAASSRDEQNYNGASSGGIASSIISFGINNNYLVYASRFINGKVAFSRINNRDEALFARGSKYVYSNPGEIYKEIKNEVKNNKVIFIGTPCQCYAIKTIVPKPFKDNLLTVDLVCHGTPSFEFLDLYLKSKEINANELNNISFRDGHSFEIKITDKNNSVLVKEMARFDPYYLLFMRCSSFQNGCYSCNFAQKERFSDLTLGDYWEIKAEDKNKFAKDKRISVVMVSSEKGKEMINSLSDLVESYETDLDYASSVNPQLHSHSEKNKDYFGLDKYFKSINNPTFKKALKRTSIPFTIKKNKFKYFVKTKILRKK